MKWMIVEKGETIEEAKKRHLGFYKSRQAAYADYRQNQGWGPIYIIPVPNLLQSSEAVHAGKEE